MNKTQSSPPLSVDTIDSSGDAAVQELLAKSEPRFKDNAEPRAEASAAILATQLISGYYAKETALHAALKKRLVTAGLIAGLQQLGASLKAAQDSRPAGGKSFELLTPAQKKQVKAAGDFLARLRDSATDGALAIGDLPSMSALGRGKRLNRKVAQTVRDLTQDFVTNAPSRQHILDEVGILPEDIEACKQNVVTLDAILLSKAQRGGTRTELSEDSRKYLLALDTGFAQLRGRARLALQEDYPQQFAELADLIPHAADRRAAPQAGAGDETPAQPVAPQPGVVN